MIRIIAVLFAMLFGFQAEAKSFSVLQFNIWQLSALGFIHFGKDNSARLAILPEMLAETNADVIALTEAWSRHTKNFIVREMGKRGYLYSTQDSNFGIRLGDGLLLLSKYPIKNVVRSSKFKPVTNLSEMLARKRARKIEIDVAGIGTIDLFQAHLGAVSFSERKDQYDPDQQTRLTKQLGALANFIERNSTSDITILAADLNTHYQKYFHHGQFKNEPSLAYLRLTQTACPSGRTFRNSFLDANHMTDDTPPVPTYDAKNPYVGSGYFSGIPSETEDYIMYCDTGSIHPVTSVVRFDEPVPASFKDKYALKKLPPRLSDHYGILTVFSQ